MTKEIYCPLTKTYYKQVGKLWRDTRDFAIELVPLTPEYDAACAEYRRLREEQGLRALSEVRVDD